MNKYKIGADFWATYLLYSSRNFHAFVEVCQYVFIKVCKQKKVHKFFRGIWPQ